VQNGSLSMLSGLNVFAGREIDNFNAFERQDLRRPQHEDIDAERQRAADMCDGGVLDDRVKKRAHQTWAWEMAAFGTSTLSIRRVFPKRTAPASKRSR
jgi:hypothetical protein